MTLNTVNDFELKVYEVYDDQESNSLLFDIHKDELDNKRRSFSLLMKIVLFLSLLLISGAAYLYYPDLYAFASPIVNFRSTNAVEYGIEIQVLSPGYEQIQSLGSLPWDAVAEPYRKQIFIVKSLTIFESNSDNVVIEEFELGEDYDIKWTIDGNTYYGQNAEIFVNKTGVFMSKVEITHSSIKSGVLLYGGSLTTAKYKLTSSYTKSHQSNVLSDSYFLNFQLAAKYIRRDIHDVSDADRIQLLDVMRLLYDVDEEAGQKLYGASYHSAETFAALHLAGAGECSIFLFKQI